MSSSEMQQLSLIVKTGLVPIGGSAAVNGGGQSGAQYSQPGGVGNGLNGLHTNVFQKRKHKQKKSYREVNPTQENRSVNISNLPSTQDIHYRDLISNNANPNGIYYQQSELIKRKPGVDPIIKDLSSSPVKHKTANNFFSAGVGATRQTIAQRYQNFLHNNHNQQNQQLKAKDPYYYEIDDSILKKPNPHTQLQYDDDVGSPLNSS